MALVTKQYLYETVSALLEGGSPSVGKKFEPRTVQAFLQQAINRKLKTEYMTVTLPGDETIPEGLVLACYNDIPVTQYKNTLSRAVLPAMPINLRRNMGVFFVGPATGGNIPTIPVQYPIITVESVIGISVVITGTGQVINGLQAGSSVVSSNAFAGLSVNIIRGNVPIPGINPTDGSNYFTKDVSSVSITFNTPLVAGEYVKIQTV
jgi:hypothetical protein